MGIADDLGVKVHHQGAMFESRIPVRWGDMDAQGHVNNAVFLDYVQDARADFIIEGEVASMMKYGVIVVDHAISYLRPVVYNGRLLIIKVFLTEVGAVRFKVAYMIYDGDDLAAVATSTMAPYDLQTGRLRRITPLEHEHFARYLWQVETPLPNLRRPDLSNPNAHHFELLTRWSDIDAFGHINNVKMLTLFQEGRIAMTTTADASMARAGTLLADDSAAMNDHATGRSTLWLMARQDIHYTQIMNYRRTPYLMRTGIARIGNSSVTMVSDIVDPEAGDAVVAHSQCVMVHADHTGRPRPVTEQMREALSRFAV